MDMADDRRSGTLYKWEYEDSFDYYFDKVVTW